MNRKSWRSVLFIALTLLLLFLLPGQVFSTQDDIVYLGEKTFFSSFIDIGNYDDIRLYSAEDVGLRNASSKIAQRIAEVEINNALIEPFEISVGDILLADLFEGEQIEIVIDDIGISNNSAMIWGSVKGLAYSYLLISYYDGRILASIELPEMNKQYQIIYDTQLEAYFLYEVDISDLKWEETEPLVVSEEQNDMVIMEVPSPAEDPWEMVTIDIMILYTPAAAEWAAVNNDGIKRVINHSMGRGQLVLENSNTHIDINTVHVAQVDYIESGSMVTDLYRLTFQAGEIFDGEKPDPDGYMDEIHSLRDTYGADLVVLYTDCNGGGIAWLLNDENGTPGFGFSVVCVKTAFNSYTFIHEIGHNLGAHHHKEQLPSGSDDTKGPGIFDYSAGWRWVGIDGKGYCSVMTYSQGRFFKDGNNHTRVPYFSNPGILYDSIPTGHRDDGDNARTLRETKHAVANYRNSGSGCVTRPNQPIGLTDGIIGNEYEYNTGGSVCHDSHDIRYRFDWGDGTYSNWSSSASGNKSWTYRGEYKVRAQARCYIGTEMQSVSEWSEPLTVSITSEDLINLQDLIDEAEPGDTIWVEEGTYQGNLVIDKELKLKAIDSNGLTTIYGDGNDHTIIINSNWVTISGFIIRNGNAGISLNDNWFCDITDNFIWGNLESGITMSESHGNNIAGNYIWGNGDHGIEVYDSFETKIANNNFWGNNKHGILIDKSSSKTNITGNEVLDNNWNGINISQSNLCEIKSNIISGNQGKGIIIEESSDDSIVDNNTISGNHWAGLEVYDSVSPTITNNDVNNNNSHGISINSSSNNSIISNNNILDNNTNGIEINGSLGGHITANGINGNQNSGLSLNGAYNVAVDNNDITTNNNGITTSGGSGHAITENNIYENRGSGIRTGKILSAGSDHLISGNNISSNNYGLWLDCDDTSVIANQITNNTGVAGLFSQGSGQSITGNTVSGNSENGVYLGGFNNEIKENHISGNGLSYLQAGIKLCCANSSGNLISDNEILENGNGVNIVDSNGNNVISGNNIADNVFKGVSISNSDHNQIAENNFTNNDTFLDSSSSTVVSGNIYNRCGIGLGGSAGSTVSGNIINNGEIYLISSAANTLSGNKVSDSVGVGIQLESSNNNTMSSNELLRSGYSGISILSSDHNIITGNEIRENYYTGIELQNSDFNQIIDGNLIVGNIMGLWLQDSSNNSLTNNTLNDNTQSAITVETMVENDVVSDNPCQGNIIDNNIINRNYGSIDIIHADGTHIGDNQIFNNQSGISISNSIDTILEGNDITGNIWHGISIGTTVSPAEIYFNTNTIVTGNIISDNETGIFLQETEPGSITETQVNYNNITGNSFAAIGFNYGLTVEETIDATCNWWGDENGPSYEGQNYVDGNINFNPVSPKPDPVKGECIYVCRVYRPEKPSGSTSGYTNIEYTFETHSPNCICGQPLEYSFWWLRIENDEYIWDYSEWSSSSSITISFPEPSTYYVDAQVRCPEDKDKVSDRSEALVVVIAENDAEQYIITVSANPAEGGDVEGGGAYDHNKEVTVTATAAEGYDFVNWTEGGEQVSTNSSYTFTAVENLTLVANFSSLQEDLEDHLQDIYPGIDIDDQKSGQIDEGEVKTSTYTSTGGKDIVFAVNWPGSKLKLSVYDPDGLIYEEKEGSSPPLVVEVKDAMAGQWSYTISGIEVPYSDYPYAVAIGLRDSVLALSALKVEPGTLTPTFNPSKTDYNVDVAHDVESIEVIATLWDASASLSILGEPATNGEAKTINLNPAGTLTIVDIVVTAEDEETIKTYNITVNKAVEVTRLSGANRFATAVEISKAGWPEGSETVVIATGMNFPDALAGAPLAYAMDAPILLTRTEVLHSDTKEEIERLDANKAVILGDTPAVSAAVEQELIDMGLTVERIGGANRFGTAVLIAEALAVESGPFDTAFITTGMNFPDALSAGSYAAVEGIPILLARTDRLVEATEEAIGNLGIENIVILGGPPAVSAAVEDELKGLVSGTVTRLGGANRFETAVMLADVFLPNHADHIFIATGMNFPDALAGAVLAAKYDSGVLLVRGDRLEPPQEVQDFYNAVGFTSVTIFGGSPAVSEEIEKWFEGNLED